MPRRNVYVGDPTAAELRDAWRAEEQRRMTARHALAAAALSAMPPEQRDAKPWRDTTPSPLVRRFGPDV